MYCNVYREGNYEKQHWEFDANLIEAIIGLHINLVLRTDIIELDFIREANNKMGLTTSFI